MRATPESGAAGNVVPPSRPRDTRSGVIVVVASLLLAACGGGGGGANDAGTPSSELAPGGPIVDDGQTVAPPVDSGDVEGDVGSAPEPSSEQTPPPEELVATWVSQADFGSDCLIRFSFNSDYSFSSEAGEERRAGFYTIDQLANAERRRSLKITFSSDNAQPNCSGSVDDETGLTFTQWVEINSLYMEWFDGPGSDAMNLRSWIFTDGAERKAICLPQSLLMTSEKLRFLPRRLHVRFLIDDRTSHWRIGDGWRTIVLASRQHMLPTIERSS